MAKKKCQLTWVTVTFYGIDGIFNQTVIILTLIEAIISNNRR